jgi:pimeloyl-ACP methyl ester carboxylesterase
VEVPDHLTYRKTWNRLAERFDDVAVDLPNHGGSDAAPDVTVESGRRAPVCRSATDL